MKNHSNQEEENVIEEDPNLHYAKLHDTHHLSTKGKEKDSISFSHCNPPKKAQVSQNIEIEMCAPIKSTPLPVTTITDHFNSKTNRPPMNPGTNQASLNVSKTNFSNINNCKYAENKINDKIEKN